MESKRHYGLDFLKFLCSFMVICIHTTIPKPISTIIIPIARIAVPIFFMITGYFYSITKENKREKKQIIKIFKIFLGANFLYLLYNLSISLIAATSTIEGFFFNKFSFASVVKFVLFNDSPFGAHLWYLGAILYVLVLVYFIEKKTDIKKLYLLIPILLLADLVFGKYSLLIFGKEYPIVLVRNFLCVGLPYFLIGNLLFNIKLKIKPNTLLLFIVIFACSTFVERSLLNSLNLNATRDHYISTTFLAVSVFLYACCFRQKNNNYIYQICCRIGSDLTLNIYILHLILLGVMSKFIMVIDNNIINAIYGYTAPILGFIGSIIVSWTFSLLTNKIKTALYKLK